MGKATYANWILDKIIYDETWNHIFKEKNKPNNIQRSIIIDIWFFFLKHTVLQLLGLT